MKNNKTLIRIFSLLLAISLLNFTVYASGNKSNNKTRTPLVITSTNPKTNQDGIGTDTSITLKFNKPINKSTSFSNIKLIDDAENIVDADIKIEGKNLIIEPLDNLDGDTLYTVIVPANAVKDKTKIALSKDYKFSFKTEAVSIASIDDITAEVNVGDEFNLPDTVTATYSDNTTGDEAIVWEADSVDTSIPGEYTFNGTVDGYDQPVTLTLDVKDSTLDTSDNSTQDGNMILNDNNDNNNYDNNDNNNDNDNNNSDNDMKDFTTQAAITVTPSAIMVTPAAITTTQAITTGK